MFGEEKRFVQMIIKSINLWVIKERRNSDLGS